MPTQLTNSSGTTIELLDFDSITPKFVKSFSYIANGLDVGQEQSTLRKNIKNPISIKSPLAVSERFGAFDMYEDPVSAIRAHVKNIILTNKGERLGNYNFGANVRQILFNSNISNIQDELTRNIQDNITRYLPVVELINMSVYTRDQVSELSENEALIRITFRIKGLNINSDLNVILGE